MSNINRVSTTEQSAASLSPSSSTESLETSAAKALVEIGNTTATLTECADYDLDEDEYESDSDLGGCHRRGAFPDDGKYDYFAARCDDTLAGWTYTKHPNSICLTPPSAWSSPPSTINVNWYKRPLRYCSVHLGYFLSNALCFVQKVEELGAEYDPDRV